MGNPTQAPSPKLKLKLQLPASTTIARRDEKLPDLKRICVTWHEKRDTALYHPFIKVPNAYHTDFNLKLLSMNWPTC